MFELLTWVDWTIIAVAIMAIVGFVIYFSKQKYSEMLNEIENTVIWIEKNMIHNTGAEKLEQAVLIVLEKFKDKSCIVRLVIKGLKADAGAKIIDAIQEIVCKLNEFSKKDDCQ